MNMNHEVQKEITWVYRQKLKGDVSKNADVLVALNKGKALKDGTQTMRISFRFLPEVANEISKGNPIVVGRCEDRLYFKTDMTYGYKATKGTTDTRCGFSVPLSYDPLLKLEDFVGAFKVEYDKYSKMYYIQLPEK